MSAFLLLCLIMFSVLLRSPVGLFAGLWFVSVVHAPERLAKRLMIGWMAALALAALIFFSFVAYISGPSPALALFGGLVALLFGLLVWMVRLARAPGHPLPLIYPQVAPSTPGDHELP